MFETRGCPDIKETIEAVRLHARHWSVRTLIASALIEASTGFDILSDALPGLPRAAVELGLNGLRHEAGEILRLFDQRDAARGTNENGNRYRQAEIERRTKRLLSALSAPPPDA